MGEDLSASAKIGITLIILVSLLAIVLSLMSMMKNITNQGAASLQSGLDQLLETRFDDYDQQLLSGTQVKSAVKLFEGQSIGVVVVTKACQQSGATAAGGYCYGAVLSGYTSSATSLDGDVYKMTTAITDMKGRGDTFYTLDLAVDTNSGALTYNMNTRPMDRTGADTFVRTSAKYMAELIKDSTGTTVGICFTQMT